MVIYGTLMGIKNVKENKNSVMIDSPSGWEECYVDDGVAAELRSSIGQNVWISCRIYGDNIYVKGTQILNTKEG